MCMANIKKEYLNWYGSYDQLTKPKHRFQTLNADSQVKVKGTWDQFLTCMERYCPEACAW